jgi:hypothetical protein
MVGAELELLRLVRLAYGAAASPEGWPPFLEAYGRALNGAVVTLLSWQRESRGSALWATAGPHASSQLVHEYNAYYAARNPWLLNAAPYMRTGGITLSHVTYPVSELRKSEFYNDLLTRFDVGCGIGACLLEADGVCAHLSMQRTLRAELCDVREVRFVRRLIPHLQRAVRIHSLLEGLRIDHRTEADALDRLSTGVLLVSADGRIRLANRRAARLLAEGDGLLATRDGLRATSAAQTRALRGLAARAARACRLAAPCACPDRRGARPCRCSSRRPSPPLAILTSLRAA